MKKPFNSKSTYVNDFRKHGQLPPVQPFRPDKNVLETPREFDDRTVYRDEYVNYRHPSNNFKNKYSKDAYFINNKIPSTTNSNSSSNSSSSKVDIRRRKYQQHYENDEQISQKRHQFLTDFSHNDHNMFSNKSFDSSSFILKQFEPRHQTKPKKTKLPPGPKTRLPFETVSLYKADYGDFSDHKNLINSSSYW